MHSFFLIRNLQIIVFVWVVWNLWPAWIAFLCMFSCNFINVNHYIQFFSFECLINSALYTPPRLPPYGYEITRSSACSLLSLLALTKILLTFSVNTLCNSLLNSPLLQPSHRLITFQTLFVVLKFHVLFNGTFFVCCLLSRQYSHHPWDRCAS